MTAGKSTLKISEVVLQRSYYEQQLFCYEQQTKNGICFYDSRHHLDLYL